MAVAVACNKREICPELEELRTDFATKERNLFSDASYSISLNLIPVIQLGDPFKPNSLRGLNIFLSNCKKSSGQQMIRHVFSPLNILYFHSIPSLANNL